MYDIDVKRTRLNFFLGNRIQLKLNKVEPLRVITLSPTSGYMLISKPNPMYLLHRMRGIPIDRFDIKPNLQETSQKSLIKVLK